MMLYRCPYILAQTLKNFQGPLVQAILNSFDEVSAERAAGRQTKTEEKYNQSINGYIVLDRWNNRRRKRWMDGLIIYYFHDRKLFMNKWLVTLIGFKKGSSCSLISLHLGILKIPKAKKISQKVLTAYYKLDICQLLQLCDGTGLNWNILIYRPIQTFAPHPFKPTEIQSLINILRVECVMMDTVGILRGTCCQPVNIIETTWSPDIIGYQTDQTDWSSVVMRIVNIIETSW